MKRTRGDTLTGGSNDVNPQWLVPPSLQATSQDQIGYVSARIPLPVNRTAPMKGKTMVIEILKVAFDLPTPVNIPQGGTTIYQSRMFLSTKNLNQTGWRDDEPSIIAFRGRRWRDYINAGTTAEAAMTETWDEPHYQDLTDGAGHGILVATDSLWMGCFVLNWIDTAVGNFDLRILYRFKEVGLTEYIGMVQSQQG